MKLDLTILQAAAAGHTAETQRLLDANSAHAKAAADATKALDDAQAQVDAYAADLASQTATLKAFNDANAPAPAAAPAAVAS